MKTNFSLQQEQQKEWKGATSPEAQSHSSLESWWVVYGPENGYNLPYPHLLRVKASTITCYTEGKVIMVEESCSTAGMMEEMTILSPKIQTG